MKAETSNHLRRKMHLHIYCCIYTSAVEASNSFLYKPSQKTGDNEMLHKENAIYTSTVAFTLLQLKHQTVFRINLHRKHTVIGKCYTRKMQFTHLLLKHQTVFGI